MPVGSFGGCEQPLLRAGELLLRPWAETDAAALVAAYTDPMIQRWHARSIDSPREAAELIADYNRGWRNETSANWAVTGPDLLGRVALRVIDGDEGCGEIAYWVTAAARGRGTAVKAAVALGDWALGDLGLHRIELYHSTANTASCRVAAKAGYSFEGTKRSATLHADGWHDMHLHALVQD